MSNNYKYEIVIYWSEEDNALIAEVPELPSCAADGATHAEALAEEPALKLLTLMPE